MSRIINYREQLDLLTDEILRTSSSTIQKIEENVRSSHTMRSSRSLVSQMDLHIDHLKSNLNQYQSILTQLNTLLIRSEYFEVQLRVLEEENQRSDNSRDDDLNWRTTEATLENLFLEFRYLSKKLDNLQMSKPGDRTPLRSFNSSRLNESRTSFGNQIASDLSGISLSRRGPLEEKKDSIATSTPPSRVPYNISVPEDAVSSAFNLRPIKCASTPVSTSKKRVPSESKSFNLLAVRNSQSANTTTNDDTTVNDITAFSDISPRANSTAITIPDSEISPTGEEKSESKKTLISSPTQFDLLPLNKSVKRHSRCISLPQSIINMNLDLDEMKPSKQSNLRHFISHDTGLKTKVLDSRNSSDSEEEDVKESQFINSPMDNFMDLFPSKRKNFDIFHDDKVLISTKDETPVDTKKLWQVQELSAYSNDDGQEQEQEQKEEVEEKEKEEEAEEEEEEQEQEEEREDDLQLPVFDHKLNRSNSCDSIFSTFQARTLVAPKRSNQEQTMSWMSKFSSRPSTVRETEASATSFSSSNLQRSSRAMHSLVSQTEPEEYVSFKNLIPSTAFSWQSLWSKKGTPTSQSSDISSQSTILTAAPSTAVTTSNLSQEPSNTQQYSQQWVSLFSKFKTENVVKPQKVVTSEIGKPIQPMSIRKPISTNPVSILEYPHRSERLKGSASTITIGPNGSKFINHGESSSLAQSLVLSSRVSHEALKEALSNDFNIV